MSFELVNHQIMRVFGGIEAEKNSSIQSLERFQKQLFDGMKKAQSGLKKMYQAMKLAQQSLVELSDNCVSVCKEGKKSGLLLTKLQYEINEMLQRISEEAFALNKKMESKIQSYLPNLKKIKEKYTGTADTLEHYSKKFALLKKSVQRQSLTKISQDEHERYERNKQKLRKAEKDHDQMLLKITKRYVEFNNQGLKDIYFDFISIMSAFGGNMIGVTNRVNKKIHDCFGSKQIVLAQQLCQNNPRGSILKQKNSDNEEISSDNKSRWLSHLIEQQQITNYLKHVLDKQLAKVESSIKISEVFSKKQVEKKTSNQNFNAFQNVYKNPPKQILNLEKVTSFGPQQLLQCSEDLLSVGEKNSVRHKNSATEMDLIEIQILDVEPDESPEIRKKSQPIDIRNKNLEKFERFVAQQKIRTLKPSLSPNNAQNQNKGKGNPWNMPLGSLQLPAKNTKNQLTIDPHDFFSIGDKNYKSTQKVQHSKSRQTLEQKKQVPNPSQFMTKVDNKPTPAKAPNNKNNLFETFDFFAVDKQPQSLSTTTAGIEQKKSDFDLLNL